MEGKIRKCVRGPLEKRLRAYTKEDPKTGCHLWTGARDPGGYGRMGLPHTSRAAHRVAWEVANGPIPAGMHVLHSCDNPRCCNPEHLKLGTHAENMREKAEKGRAPRRWRRAISRKIRSGGRGVRGLRFHLSLREG